MFNLDYKHALAAHDCYRVCTLLAFYEIKEYNVH